VLTVAGAGGQMSGEARAPLGRAEVVALLAEHSLHPSRALGQNFVVDPNTVRRIARLARVGPGDRVVEIGAGLGSLTLALLATGAAVTAVEVDAHLMPALRSVVEPAGAAVVEGDALRLDWRALLGDAGESWALVANLPYNIATPLVARLLEEVPQIRRMLVMVQKEVAERLAAGAGDDAYGAVSVKVAYFAVATLVGRVSPEVFVPRPRVDSALVEIVRRTVVAVPPEEVPYGELMELVRAGFATRRKMLRRALAGLVGPAAFECAGISPEARAEMLDVQAWGTLARCRRSIGNPPPPS
jgi:16S rRNA (adenine1518-N6/adenine1519-N6)-dimethyltransferase